MRRSDRRGMVRATLALLAAITVGQGVAGWFAYAEEAGALGREAEPCEYTIDAARQATGQCELHQLLVRAAGLAVLLVSAMSAPARAAGVDAPDRRSADGAGPDENEEDDRGSGARL